MNGNDDKQRVHGLLDKGQRLEADGDLQGAVHAYQMALSIVPDDPRAMNRMGVAAYRAGRLEQAEALIRRAIAVEPDRWDYHKALGNVYKHQGRKEAAEAHLLRAVSLSPESAEAHYDLGIVYQLSGRSQQAVTSYRSAVHHDPDYAQAWNNMGLIHLSQDERDKAIDCFETAIAKKPDFSGAYNNLGNLYKTENDFLRAVHCYKKSLSIDSKQTSTYTVLGNTYQLMHKPMASMECYQQAIRWQPELADNWVNLGTAFQDLDDLKKSIECYQKALTLNPRVPQAYLNLGLVYKELGRHTEVLSCLERAIELDPEYENALVHLVTYLIGQCEWESVAKYGKKLDRNTQHALKTSRKPAENPFLNLIRHADPALNYTVARAWGHEWEKTAAKGSQPFSFDYRKGPQPRIKIGYLSGNFRNHPTSDLILGVFEFHNRRRFSINCYAYGKDDGSLQRKAIRTDSDNFNDISNLDDLSAATLIHNDQVDVLVDLMGHIKGARLGICALRPAPIQVRMLGMAGTTGASFFDYLISDRIVTPEIDQFHFKEKFVLMPHCYQVNNYKSEPLMAADPGNTLKDYGRFVFACFCTAYKIDRQVFKSWMRILKRVTDSELWLMPESSKVKQNLCKAAQSLGVDHRRLVFLEKLEKNEHLNRLLKVDLALDTPTVNGAAATSDALWAGCPVLTLEGSHFASRMSASLLSAVRMSALVVRVLGSYEDTAVALAQTPAKLKRIRQKLNKNVLDASLFNTGGFVKLLEDAFAVMWGCHREDRRPALIEPR